MADPHCTVVAQSLVKSLPTALLCDMTSSKEAAWISPAVLPALIAFVGGLVALLWNGWLQRRIDRKKLDQSEQTARAIAYAELWRLWREMSYAIKFVEKDAAFQGGMIWIPVFRSIYPNKDNLTRIDLLTAKEVGAITSVYYVYQEAMVFLKASALAVLPLVEDNGQGIKKRRPPLFSLEEDAIEYVYKIDSISDHCRREEVLKWLRIIVGQTRKALNEIESSVLARFPQSDLAAEIKAKESAVPKRLAPDGDPRTAEIEAIKAEPL